MPDRPLRFGLSTPITVMFEREAPVWIREGGPDELRAIAIAADRLGYHHLTCSEHVAIPTDIVPVRGGRYYDPLATFGFMAAVTERVRFLTHVIVLPYHHPLEVAKRYGTLDRMAKGRLILGVGVGTLRPEFELVGAEFEGRGERYSDALRALRAALGQREPSYHGSHYDFDGFVVDPCATQERMPIWLGGRTARSLRRALAGADGWDPFNYSCEAASDLLARAREWPEWQQRSDPFEVALMPDRHHDPRTPGGRAATIDDVARYQSAGATVLNLSFPAPTLDDYIEQLAAFQADVAPRFR